MKVETNFAPELQALSQSLLLEKYAQQGESSVAAIQARVAKALASDEHQERRFQETMRLGFVPAGRINRGAGADLAVTLLNCFVQPVADTISGHIDGQPGIFEALREAAETMRRGGGVGYDFSGIRPAGARVFGTASDASGPLSYMRVFDKMCETVNSAGNRRGAQMGVLRIDHPDIERFVDAKKLPDLAALGLDERSSELVLGLLRDQPAFAWAFRGAFATLSNFNLSVAVTDEFMRAVESDDDFDLVHSAPPSHECATKVLADGRTVYVYRTVKAKVLWEQIMTNTYDGAEPGVVFIDRINWDNNLRAVETISAVNPCGEQGLPAYGCCDLGSMHLSRFVREPFTGEAAFDYPGFRRAVTGAVEMLDRVLDVSRWPLPEQQSQARSKRRIGVGYFAMGDALAMLGLRYGSEASVAFVDRVGREMRDAAYEASVELARKFGAFPLFAAEEFLAEGTFASRLPARIKDMIREHGIRNSHLLSLAPTGTIALTFGDNASSGIEPIYALSQVRSVRQKDGSRVESTVFNAAYRAAQNALGPKVDATAFPTVADLTVDDHLAVIAAAAPLIDAGISKTVNVPANYPFADFAGVYLRAWKAGLKGITTYRENNVLLGSVIAAGSLPAAAPPVTQSMVPQECGAYSAIERQCPSCNAMTLVKKAGCDGCDCGYSACDVS